MTERGMTEDSTSEDNTTGKTVPRMPYGKYKGWAVANVPLPYLRWFLKNGKAPPPVLDAIALRAAPALLKSLDKELARMDKIVAKNRGAKSATGKTTESLSPLEVKFRDMTQKLAARLREAQKEAGSETGDG